MSTGKHAFIPHLKLAGLQHHLVKYSRLNIYLKSSQPAILIRATGS